jgi:hypothetical protein
MESNNSNIIDNSSIENKISTENTSTENTTVVENAPTINTSVENTPVENVPTINTTNTLVTRKKRTNTKKTGVTKINNIVVPPNDVTTAVTGTAAITGTAITGTTSVDTTVSTAKEELPQIISEEMAKSFMEDKSIGAAISMPIMNKFVHHNPKYLKIVLDISSRLFDVYMELKNTNLCKNKDFSDKNVEEFKIIINKALPQNDNEHFMHSLLRFLYNRDKESFTSFITNSRSFNLLLFVEVHLIAYVLKLDGDIIIRCDHINNIIDVKYKFKYLQDQQLQQQMQNQQLQQQKSTPTISADTPALNLMQKKLEEMQLQQIELLKLVASATSNQHTQHTHYNKPNYMDRNKSHDGGKPHYTEGSKPNYRTRNDSKNDNKFQYNNQHNNQYNQHTIKDSSHHYNNNQYVPNVLLSQQTPYNKKKNYNSQNNQKNKFSNDTTNDTNIKQNIVTPVTISASAKSNELNTGQTVKSWADLVDDIDQSLDDIEID